MVLHPSSVLHALDYKQTILFSQAAGMAKPGIVELCSCARTLPFGAGSLDAVNRLTNSIAVLLTISYGGWLAVCGQLTVGFIYSAFTFSFQLAMGFSSLVTMTGGVPALCSTVLDARVVVKPTSG